MKLVSYSVISLLAFISVACSKDNNPGKISRSTSVRGVFHGKYGFQNQAPGANYTLNFKRDGTIEELGQSSGNPIARGAYTLKGNHISAKYTMLFTQFISVLKNK
ncbi:MAG: hypothetical protein JNK79_18630 [Chitinophagaceae bacterium]|nr:hypothetical protein [Chitinophagaceae bacterium]